MTVNVDVPGVSYHIGGIEPYQAVYFSHIRPQFVANTRVLSYYAGFKSRNSTPNKAFFVGIDKTPPESQDLENDRIA